MPQAFKIVMDDIFGPGRNVDKNTPTNLMKEN